MAGGRGASRSPSGAPSFCPHPAGDEWTSSRGCGGRTSVRPVPVPAKALRRPRLLTADRVSATDPARKSGRQTGTIRRRATILVALALGGCGSTPRTTTSVPSTPAPKPTPTPTPALLPALCRARQATVLGRVRDPDIDELSGLVRGRRDPKVLFGEEDSGSPADVVALKTDGTLLAHLPVTGAANVDWEDIAAGPAPDGTPSLFLADIGDNEAVRGSVQVYRVPEPRASDGATAPATRLDLRYPDGAHDAETLLADPLRPGELTLVTKTLAGGRAYAVPRDGGTLRRGPELRLGPITAGDVSADGHVVALRTYTTLVVWRRAGREALTETLARKPACVAPARLGTEGQGEALALDAHGRTAITAPEGPGPLVRRYG